MSKTTQEHTLSNGLKLLGEVNTSNVSAAIGFFVRTGARDEMKEESGVSHFLEHMMFKGTPTRSALDISLQLGNLGAQANAFTSEENTVYYAVIVPEQFSAMQELLSDMLRPSLDQQEYDTEKQVILEEIALYQDRPNFFLAEKAFELYFGKHPAGQSVLGSHSSISALTRDQMAAYFKRRYAPNNIVLVASGNFDWATFVANAEKYCGSWTEQAAPRHIAPFGGGSPGSVLRRKDLVQAHAILIGPGPSAQDEERYPIAILSTILGDSSGSRLYWELVDKGIAEVASTDNDERDGTGCFTAYVRTEPGRLDEVLNITRGILASPRDFSDADLERAKSKIKSRVVLDGELPMGRLMALGLEWTYRKETTPLKEIIHRVDRISRNDINQTIDKFGLANWSEYRLLPDSAG